MILPAGVQQSITKNNIDISTGWMFASFPIWNLDYSAQRPQPVSLAAVPLADLRFLDPTVTLVIRQSASPGSLVLWSGVAAMDDDSGEGGIHNDLLGRGESDTHPLASITGLVDALDSKAPAFVSDGQRLFWATPSGGAGVPSLRPIVLADLPTLSFLPLAGGDVSGTIRSTVSGFQTWTTAILVSSTNPSILLQNTGNTADGRIWRIRATGAAQFTISSSDDTESAALNAISFSRSAGVLTARILTAGGSGTIILGGTLTTDLPTGFVRSTAGTLGVVSALSGTDLVLANGTTIPQSTFATAIPSGAQNLVLATPAVGSGTAALRSLVADDIPILNSLGNIAGAGPNIILSATDGYLRIGSTPVAHFGTTGFGLDQIYSYDLADFWLSKSSSGPYPRSQLMMAAAFYTGSDGSELKVVDARRTGWTAATGTATRTTFATSTVTLPQLAEHVKALLDDLIAHGLIGA